MQTLPDSEEAGAAKAADPLRFAEEARETVSLGLALGLSQLAQVLMGMTDVFMMARFGTDALAAGSLVNSMVLLVFLFGMGVLQATAPLMGTALGSGRADHVGVVFRAGTYVALGLALGLSAYTAMLGPCLAMTGQQPEVVRMGGRFALWLLPGLWASLVFVMQRVYLSTFGAVKILGVASLAGVLVNAVGNDVLMYGRFGLPALGPAGCAASTSVTNLFLIAAIHLLLRTNRGPAYTVYRQRASSPTMDLFRLLRSIARVGLPIGFVLLSEYVVMAGAGLLMGRINTTVLAAYSVCLQWLAVFYMIPVGLSQAATTRISLAIGRRDLGGIRLATWAAVGAAVAYGLIAMGVMMVKGRWLAQLLLARTDAAEVLELTGRYMIWNAGLLFISGLVVVCAGIMRGFRETKTPMILVFLFYWLGSLGSAMLLSFFLRDLGVWFGMLAGFAATLLGIVAALRRKLRELPIILDQIAQEDGAMVR